MSSATILAGSAFRTQASSSLGVHAAKARESSMPALLASFKRLLDSAPGRETGVRERAS